MTFSNPRAQSFLQQALAEHDFDDSSHRLFAGPIALKLARQRDPAEGLASSLSDPLEAGPMGFGGRAANRIDNGIDLVALASASRAWSAQRGTPNSFASFTVEMMFSTKRS